MIHIRFYKQVDWAKTLENYEIRLSQCRKAFFEELHGQYVSDFVTKKGLSSNHRLSHVPILIKIAKRHGIVIQGFFPANKRRAATNDNETNEPVRMSSVIFVGKANPLTGIKSDSKYAIRKEDFAYLEHTKPV